MAITVVAAGFPVEPTTGSDGEDVNLPPPKVIYNSFGDAITKKK